MPLNDLGFQGGFKVISMVCPAGHIFFMICYGFEWKNSHNSRDRRRVSDFMRNYIVASGRKTGESRLPFLYVKVYLKRQ